MPKNEAGTKSVQDARLERVGFTGTVKPFMMLVSALEEAKPGDRILLASWGNGDDAIVFKAAHQMENMKADKKGRVISFSRDFPGVDECADERRGH